MATTPTDRLLTAEELFDMPDDGNFYELVRGRLVQVPPSFFSSSMIATTLASFIAVFVRLHKLGICGGEAGGIKTESDPDTVRAPDFTFISNARLPAGGLPRRFYPTAPDLVVEVMSPSDRTGNLLRKIEEYLAAGTRLAWLILPDERSAIIFHQDRAPITLSGSATLDGEDVLPGFTLPLAELWTGLADEDA